MGIQGYRKGIDKRKERDDLFYGRVSDLYVELKSKTAGKDYVFDFTEVDEIAFIDSVHTTDESAQVMGTIYADLILNQSPDFIGKLVLSYLIQ